jgi:hypothetical protein
MKKILFVICLLFCVPGFSQSFTLSELVKLSKYNEDDFDTYVTKKGYVFEKIRNGQYSNSTGYTFLVNGYSNSFISKVEDKTGKNKYWVTFQTPNTNYYLAIKSELKANGYILINKEEFEGKRVFNYRRGKNKVSIFFIIETNEYTDKVRNAYEISFEEEY